MSLKDTLVQLGSMMPKPEGFKYGSLYDYFAKEGDSFGSCRPPEEAKVLKAIGIAVRSIRPKQKECFYNAQRLAQNFPQMFVYCEGFVSTARLGFPIHHGWVVRLNPLPGQPHALVDPTLRVDPAKGHGIANLVVGAPPPGWEYVGRAFPLASVTARWATGEAGSLIDWPPKWPFLRQPEVEH